MPFSCHLSTGLPAEQPSVKRGCPPCQSFRSETSEVIRGINPEVITTDIGDETEEDEAEEDSLAE